MTFRTSLLLVATLSLAGCSTAAEEAPAAASSDVVVANDLVDRTIIKGKVSIGETSKVGYEPDLYKQLQIDGVPYLAWEIVKPETSLATRAGDVFDTATITVGVVGNFPSEPDVLIVDSGFVVLSATKGRTTDLGDEATLVVDANKGAKFVLVRDMDWVRPMDFEIAITE